MGRASIFVQQQAQGRDDFILALLAVAYLTNMEKVSLVTYRRSTWYYCDR